MTVFALQCVHLYSKQVIIQSTFNKDNYTFVYIFYNHFLQFFMERYAERLSYRVE